MHSHLLLKAFEKAGKDIGSEVVNRQAIYLSEFIFENSGETYGEKSLIINYNRARSDSETKIEFKQYVVQSLCSFLEFKNFQEFNKRNPKPETSDTSNNFKEKLFIWVKKNKILLTILILVSILFFVSVDRQRWMIWNSDHYVEANFDANKVQNGTLKLYKEDRIENFRRIEPDSTYTFFNKDGSVRLWYGKNSQGDLEYFTDLGLHPETGKTLKPITQYMINKYIRKLTK